MLTTCVLHALPPLRTCGRRSVPRPRTALSRRVSPAVQCRIIVENGMRTESVKANLTKVLHKQNRGIFGTTAATKQAIEQLLAELEQQNQATSPAQNLQQFEGVWRLLYTSLTIKGGRKTKLGLREFVTLGDFEQIIDVQSAQAINKVGFSVTGLGNLAGSLTIRASFKPVSDKRVSIAFEKASLVPKALEQLFASNYDLLLSIFNPEGWLDITFIDDCHRIGRDDKGNVFYLQRC